jgi:chromosomal replication initiator protein
LWETALGQLELLVTPPNFDTWLRNTVGLQLDGDHFVVGVPSDFALEWLRSRMAGPVSQTVSTLLGQPTTISFQVLGAPSTPTEAPNGRLQEPARRFARPELDPQLTFDSFITVKGNRLAYRASRQLTGGTTRYGLLVLLGAPGLGKTHLLHAIGHEAVASGQQVVALTGEAFVNHYSAASRRGHPHTFRDMFADCQLLLLDDLSFLATRAASQEQFFHIFNDLRSAGARVVVTIDTPPRRQAGFSSRLRSRLDGGLTAEITPPSSAERQELVTALASRLSNPLPDDMLRAIAQEPYESVRELEGALHRVSAYAEMGEEPPSLDTVNRALQALPPKSHPSAQAILDVVCRHFRISLEEVTGPSRSRDVTFARHVAMYLLRLRAQRSFTQIGQLFGGRDHSTVLTACRRITREVKTLPETKSVIQQLESDLQQQQSA